MSTGFAGVGLSVSHHQIRQQDEVCNLGEPTDEEDESLGCRSPRYDELLERRMTLREQYGKTAACSPR